eukprot:jgi/Picsp_1/1178/NSC_04659-R1_---NA---
MMTILVVLAWILVLARVHVQLQLHIPSCRAASRPTGRGHRARKQDPPVSCHYELPINFQVIGWILPTMSDQRSEGGARVNRSFNPHLRKWWSEALCEPIPDALDEKAGITLTKDVTTYQNIGGLLFPPVGSSLLVFVIVGHRSGAGEKEYRGGANQKNGGMRRAEWNVF